MTLSERRRDNLNQWFEHLMQTQFQTGKAICEHYGLSVAEVSQLLNSHRPISQKTARLLEQQLQLAEGALDLEEMLQYCTQQVQVSQPLHHISIGQKIEHYAMASVQAQVFALEISSDVLSANVDLHGQSSKDVYQIGITGSDYAPMLNAGWTVLCNRALDAQAQDWVCVKLVNELCLFLQFVRTTTTEHYFQSLDQQKAVSFACADVRHIDPIVMIYTRSD
ncbi:hypothetical protein [Acinetobacter cumulans]|nr:hypothetical protein [Acinetobacter cumulans]